MVDIQGKNIIYDNNLNQKIIPSGQYTRRVGIFDAYLKGHNLEYLHHIYINAINEPDTHFTFIIPSYFKDIKGKLSWPPSTNISFYFFDLSDKEYLSLSSPLKKSKRLSLELKKAIKALGIKEVVLLETIAFMPLLPFIIGRDIKLTSIVYYIPLYFDHSSTKRRLFDTINFWLLAKSRCFKRVCLLNAKKEVEYYNTKYSTTKFTYLPDPYNNVEPTASPKEIRNRLGISNEKNVFIHFGGMTRRKGTLDILNAILQLDEKDLQDKCFIFAGRIGSDILEEFEKIMENVKKKTQIIVFNEFCEYSLLADICNIADYMLIPYKNTAQSSGLCSYAAQFKIATIGPGEGVLGNIIRDNRLGVGIENLQPDKIAKIISNIKDEKIVADIQKCDDYIINNSPYNFFCSLIRQ